MDPIIKLVFFKLNKQARININNNRNTKKVDIFSLSVSEQSCKAEIKQKKYFIENS